MTNDDDGNDDDDDYIIAPYQRLTFLSRLCPWRSFK